jgi:rod shape-determining protein MreD
MKPTLITRPITDRLRSKTINREPSSILAIGVPWAAIMLGSMSPTWPLITSAPILPPLGFVLLLVWRQIRPGILPVWAGLPLGAFDDVFSGQPFGSGILLWSAAMILLEVVEARFPWRNFLFEWLVSAGFVCAYLVLCLICANWTGASAPLQVIVPQAMTSVLLIPLLARFAALLDHFRLLPLVPTD